MSRPDRPGDGLQPVLPTTEGELARHRWRPSRIVPGVPKPGGLCGGVIERGVSRIRLAQTDYDRLHVPSDSARVGRTACVPRV